MKRLLILVLSSFLLITACGQKEESKTENKKTEEKQKNQSKDKKKEESKNEDQTKNQEKHQSNETQQTPAREEASSQAKTPQVNISNVTDRSTLENIINGNYSEMEKIEAYNSAVANGVIPQGNVMEGPASAAYQSSLRIESGAEKSVYDQSDNSNEDNKQTSSSTYPRSLRQIKEDTGKGASDFTQEELDEAKAYARQH